MDEGLETGNWRYYSTTKTQEASRITSTCLMCVGVGCWIKAKANPKSKIPDMNNHQIVHVDVLCAVHNAQDTISETIDSVLHQKIPQHLISDSLYAEDHYTDGYGRYNLSQIHIDVAICCYDDGSSDHSLSIIQKIQNEASSSSSSTSTSTTPGISVQIIIACNHDNDHRTSYGAGYARNQAAQLRPFPIQHKDHYFICILDSDDIMHPHRIAEQVSVMLHLSPAERHRTLLGCTFDRIPADSTWHYTRWANTLSDYRLYLERFREVTIIQPTWIMTRLRFIQLGGYITTSTTPPHHERILLLDQDHPSYQLIHPLYDNQKTLRLAEDLRFFHAHLFTHEHEQQSNSLNVQSGSLKLLRTKQHPLLTYRHRIGLSQSSSTPRKLLFQLRTKAFEDSILKRQEPWVSKGFVIWGAGRDGKDFFKSLSDNSRPRVHAFVDVDAKKYGYYEYKNPIDSKVRRIPIVHFGYLMREHQTSDFFGRITKQQRIDDDLRPCSTKSDDCIREQSIKTHCLSPKDTENLKLINSIMRDLPVVVCVAMYRTNEALEKNVSLIGRTEGEDLWHFC